MAPSFDFADSWGKEIEQGITPVVVTMENPIWSVLELENENAEDDGGGGFYGSTSSQGDKDRRGKKARQLTWVLLLKAHRAVGCVSWLAMGLWAVFGLVKKRVIYRQGGVAMEPDSNIHKGKLFMFIKTFLAFAVAALVLEIGAYMMGWHFPIHNEVGGIFHSIYPTWVYFRSNYIAPPLQALADICTFLFLIQSADRFILSIGCFWIKYTRIKPKPKDGVFVSGDVEQAGAAFPMVLIQIPMCNERETRRLFRF